MVFLSLLNQSAFVISHKMKMFAFVQLLLNEEPREIIANKFQFIKNCANETMRRTFNI